ncbi:MAG: hypothetical protein LBD37_08465 [Treponema sp.]|jgi:hypothetical protein|nr:hypothetical protein [Treponema sp.]
MKSIGAAVALRRGVRLLLVLLPVFLGAEPLVSATWGFALDLPEEFQFQDGNGRDRFSFMSPGGVIIDLAVYPGGAYPSVEALTKDIQKRLGNRGEISPFVYRNKQAALVSLQFSNPAERALNGTNQGGDCEGWGLCVELEGDGSPGRPLLAALVFSRAGIRQIQSLYFSALDSIAPTQGDRLAPGPITEFTYPRGKPVLVRPAHSRVQGRIYEYDAEGAQSLVDLEFTVLSRYTAHPRWKEAWIRFYRRIYRDSYDRIADLAFSLERGWHKSGPLAAQALQWVQSFQYERDLMGSDFVNLVSAAIEGRGDCDSRSLLWAIILNHANIPAAVMVSREYSHAMGLADIPGQGARFTLENKQWLVAETTAKVDLGLIAAQQSVLDKWIGVSFE